MDEAKRPCRFCKTPLAHSFADLGMSPLANSYLSAEKLSCMEPFYPLHAYVCTECYLVQLEEFESPQHIFSDYAYFSSYSDSWLRHAKAYVDTMMRRYDIDNSWLVVEIASNDGYLLQYFTEKSISVLGIEPAENVAKVAQEKGIPSITKFFGTKTAQELVASGKEADLLIANNVLAHVPNLNDFVAGLKILLKPNGLVTLEFPHLMKLMEQNQFDTIYHEHFSYFSFITVEKVLKSHGLVPFDIEELPTHGGSLRIYAKHEMDATKPVTQHVHGLRETERLAGLTCLDTFAEFDEQVRQTKRKLLAFLIEAKREGHSIVAYGAPAKGNTLLNYCGIRSDFLDYTVDASPHKQNCFLPGTHLPIHAPEKISQTKPDYILILPWNLREEIMDKMSHIRQWGGRFVVPIPELQIYP